MRWSFKIGHAFGIELRVHVTFFLIVAWIAYVWGIEFGHGTAGWFYGAVLISLLFVCVVIHELCHSRMAQHYGAEVASITLLPIGGIAMLKSMPEEPRKELWVSLVGPASNLVIAAVLAVVLAALPGKAPVDTPEQATEILTGISLQGLVTYLFFVNILLAVFNLVPAFPLDGGRVLRSLLAQRMSYIRATRVAVTAGQVFAFILGITGLLTGYWLWIIIAVFIYLGAEQEGAGVEMKQVLSSLKARQAVATDGRTLAPGDSLGHAVELTLRSYQEDFPVVEDGRLVGVLPRASLVSGLHRRGPETAVGEVMERDFPTVDADAPFSRVYEKMNESGIKAVPVLDDGRLLGIVTLEHLSEVFLLLSATDEPLVRK